MSSDQPSKPAKLTQFRVIQSTPPSSSEWSLDIIEPQPFDVKSNPIAGCTEPTYRISQPLAASQAVTFHDESRRNGWSDPRWLGVSRCGDYVVAIRTDSIRVVSVNDASDVLFTRYLSKEEWDTFFVEMLRTEHDPLDEVEFYGIVSYRSAYVSASLTMQRPRMVDPGKRVLQKDLLSYLYFQFSLRICIDDDNDTILRFSVPIVKTYGSTTLVVSTLDECVSALQAVWATEPAYEMMM